MIARQHHYPSQCYLKGFTTNRSKKSKLTVIDLEHGRSFETIPRNVGDIRDFNRIDVDGINPNILEDSLSNFEGAVATSLTKLRCGARFDGEVRDVILNLLALFAVRSPYQREHWQKFEVQIAERIIDLILANKERWKLQISQMRNSGVKINDNVTYDGMKKFHEGKQYAIKVAREHLIGLELTGVDAILPLLYARKWLIVRTSPEMGLLITADHPVVLTWTEPEKIPPLRRDHPGYGLRETRVIFRSLIAKRLSENLTGQKGY